MTLLIIYLSHCSALFKTKIVKNCQKPVIFGMGYYSEYVLVPLSDLQLYFFQNCLLNTNYQSKFCSSNRYHFTSLHSQPAEQVN